MRTVVLDLESSLSEPWTEETFPPLPLHVPEVAVWLISDAGQFEVHSWDRSAEPEPAGMERIASSLRGADRLVGWNTRGFDMPLLGLRALVCGTDWSWWESRRHRYPNWKTPLWHYDLCDQLSEYGAARGLSLERVAHLLGLPGKSGTHSRDVHQALADGDRSGVLARCAEDVIETYLIYLRWSATHGGAPAAREAEGAVLDWAARQPLLEAFHEDEPELLGEKGS